MIVCVHDANILIDLAKSGLFEAYARLGWTTYVPDLVLREVKQEVSPYVRSGTIQVRAFDGSEITGILHCWENTPEDFRSKMHRLSSWHGLSRFPC